MRKFLRTPVLATAALAGMALATVVAPTVSANTSPDMTVSASAPQAPVEVCPPPAPGYVQCQAMALPGSRHKAAAMDTPDGTTALPAGYGPADLQSAYGLTSAVTSGAGTGETVALVDANGDPTAESDLAAYRSTYGLPACTTANGCFRKVNEEGQASPLPVTDGSWAVETSLDLDAVSAVCPACHILLVEADAGSLDDVAVSEDTAASLGANVISNSYSGAENGDFMSLASSYDHPGIAITAATGDYGYSLEAPFPADLPTVTAVGGTALTKAANQRGWSETAWSAAGPGSGSGGSGCSAWIAKPSWQHDTACPGRTIGDVSADASPETGYAIYDTTPNPLGLTPGWMVIGGTSGATPLIAGVYALAGNAATIDNASGIYAKAKQLNDVIGGNNTDPDSAQDCPNSSYLCTAMRGYDAPTGNGTPNGIGAF